MLIVKPGKVLPRDSYRESEPLSTYKNETGGPRTGGRFTYLEIVDLEPEVIT